MPHGKVCYLEIPAITGEASAAFYRAIFGWTIRKRGDGALAFDDSGDVSGTWVKENDRPPDEQTRVYIMVDDIPDTLEKIQDAGGRVLTPRTDIAPGSGAFAVFADPAGAEFGLYEEPKRLPADEHLNMPESTASERIAHQWYSRPVLFVSDVQAALGFYIDKLGFEKKWHKGTVCQVDRGGCEIILCEDSARRDRARLFVELNRAGIDELRREISERSVPSQKAWWGYDVIRIADPDGNELLFPLDETNDGKTSGVHI